MYTTLTQVKQYLGKDAATADDNRLAGFILAAENTINAARSCCPRRQTRLFDYPLKASEPFGVYAAADRFVSQMNAASLLGAGKLALDADLLELESVVNGDGREFAPGDLVSEPANLYPRQNLRLVRPGLCWLPGAGGQREQVISVTGVWGWHPDYSNAWQLVDSLAAGVDAATTSLRVTDVDGPDENGMTPRLQPGQLLRLDTEYLICTAVETATDLVTVRRAQNGTTAAAHASAGTLCVYRPPARIAQCATRIAVWLYRQKDANVFDKTTILNTGVAITPSALPTDARDMLPPARLSL